MAAADRFVTITVGQYELALEKLRTAAGELEALLGSRRLAPSARLRTLRTLGEVECLRAVLESRKAEGTADGGQEACR